MTAHISSMVRRWWSTSAPWSQPLRGPGAGVTVAVDIAGQPCRFPLGAGHLLVAGVTGSGKSTVLRSFLRHAADRPDVAIVGVDLKAVELSPWRPRLSAFVDHQLDARALLLVVLAELRARRDALLRGGLVAWDPALGPWLLVVIDELAELVDAVSTAKADRELASDITACLVSIGRLGRALGVHLVSATQRPDAESLTGALRGQHDWRVGLRMRDPAESRMVCPPAVADLTTLAAGGEAMWLPPLPWPSRVCRAELIPVADVPAIAAATAHLRPPLGRLDVLAGVR